MQHPWLLCKEITNQFLKQVLSVVQILGDLTGRKGTLGNGPFVQSSKVVTMDFLMFCSH